VGKSSLLHNLLLGIAAQGRVRTAYIDCREVASVRELAFKLSRIPLQVSTGDRRARGWLATYGQLFSLTVKEALGRVATIRVKAVRDLFEAHLEFREQSIDERELLVRAFSFLDAYTAERDLELLLVLDEFQELAGLGDWLFGLFKSRGQRDPNLAFIYSGSASSLLEKVFLAPGSPLYLTAGKTRLGPLEAPAVETFVKGRLAGVGLSLAEGAFETFYELTGGLPYYVQKLGQQLYLGSLTDGNRGPPLSKERVRLAFEAVVEELGAEFEARLAQAYASLPRRLLVALGRSHPEPVRRKELAEVVGLPTTALSQPLNSLLLEGAIEQPGRGRYRIADPLFGAWLAGLGAR